MIDALAVAVFVPFALTSTLAAFGTIASSSAFVPPAIVAVGISTPPLIRPPPAVSAVACAMFTDVEGAPQPAPAPRFSRTPTIVQGAPVRPGANTDEAMAAWGFTPDEVARLTHAGAVSRA